MGAMGKINSSIEHLHFEKHLNFRKIDQEGSLGFKNTMDLKFTRRPGLQSHIFKSHSFEHLGLMGYN